MRPPDWLEDGGSGDGEADVGVRSGAGEDDADDAAVGVDHRPTGVAGTHPGLQLVNGPASEVSAVDVAAKRVVLGQDHGRFCSKRSAAWVADSSRPGTAADLAGQDGKGAAREPIDTQHGYVEARVEEEGGRS